MPRIWGWSRQLHHSYQVIIEIANERKQDAMCLDCKELDGPIPTSI